MMQVVIGERGHCEQSEEGRNGSRREDRTLTARQSNAYLDTGDVEFLVIDGKMNMY
jgi:hypothetical protein